MRMMDGAVAESGVVGVLFGVGERGGKKIKVKNPTPSASLRTSLNRNKRDLEWGTRLEPGPFELPSAFESCGPGQSADRSVRATQSQVTYKRLGERAEAAFLAKAAGLGFGVAKPWGDSDRYDFILDVGGRLWKVQVKSAHRVGADGGYSFRLFGHSVGAYADDEIDLLVCYLVPEDAWYVFPPSVFLGRRSVKLFGGSLRRRSKFEVYREGWWVLDGKVKNFTTLRLGSGQAPLHRGRTEVH